MDVKEKKFIEDDGRAREIATWGQLFQHARAADDRLAEIEQYGGSSGIESVLRSHRERAENAEADLIEKDKRIMELGAEARDQRVRGDTNAHELTLARNELDNSGSSYSEDGKELRLRHGIKHLSRRAHDAEAKLAARLDRTESTCSSVLADMGIARDPMCDTGLAQLQGVASHQCGRLMAAREALEAAQHDLISSNGLFCNDKKPISFGYWELKHSSLEKVESALAADAGKGKILIDPTEAREVTMQEMSDCGINPFAAHLVSESFVKHPNPKPVTFRYQGALFHMRPLQDA